MRLTKRFKTGSIWLFIACCVNTVNAQDRISPIEIRGNIGVVSDYVFRGVTLSDEDPVVQGGLDLILPKGFYVGAWASGVDKPWGGVYNQIAGREDFEYDLYAGWQWQNTSRNLRLDTGVIRYGFSSDPDDIAWSEVYLSASLYRKLRVKVSTDIDGLDFGTYYEASFRQPLAKSFDATFHVGHFDVADRLVRELEQYTDFSFGVGRSYRGFRFDLTYHRTDRDGRARYLESADDRLTLSIKRDFELFPNFRMFQF
jgi:uncharacterized protein (TIGR02001 family)